MGGGPHRLEVDIAHAPGLDDVLADLTRSHRHWSDWGLSDDGTTWWMAWANDDDDHDRVVEASLRMLNDLSHGPEPVDAVVTTVVDHQTRRTSLHRV